MTEREKMLAGMLYNCGDAELLAQWHRAKNLTTAYNKIAYGSPCRAQKDNV